MLWLVAIVTFVATLLSLGPLKRGLEHRAVLDRPNDRSSHAVPVPRGGGLVVVPVVAAAWAGLAGGMGSSVAIAALALGIAAIFWLDDLRGLAVLPRLVAQIVAVAAGVALLPPEALVFQGWLPLALDRATAALLWLWFVNLYNFMDGIDGLTGIATAVAGAGAALCLAIAGGPGGIAGEGLVLAAAALGFLVWNRPPARLFLGDVGSVGLGFLVGWLLLRLAAEGLWAAALLLPLYHLGDATLTLCLRLARGDRVWLASRAHFYQRGVVGLGGHAPVLIRILGAKLALAGLAAFATAVPAAILSAVLVGSLIVLAMLWYFASSARKAPDAAR